MQSKKFRFAMVSHSIEVVNIVRKCLKTDTEDLFATLVGLDDAVTTAEKLIEDGDTVLVKGSRGMKMEEIVDKILAKEV